MHRELICRRPQVRVKLTTDHDEVVEALRESSAGVDRLTADHVVAAHASSNARICRLIGWKKDTTTTIQDATKLTAGGYIFGKMFLSSKIHRNTSNLLVFCMLDCIKLVEEEKDLTKVEKAVSRH